ncbi:hypothetical protein HDU98_011340 [Podochytrium sp. JEL0797]|nr:hypothetical protein HDU98_011340 [Podochytrium sp. JEL0797]
MFDCGRGKGGKQDGPSFFEYLATRGYDTYALDLRGTREARRMGTASPAFIKEHIEVDVPSAIAFIKAKYNHEKVYLVGHSMGGAISCAVAGYMPHSIAGVVHLAGLYHLTLPILGDMIDLYHSTLPTIVKSAVSTGTQFFLRSVFHLFNPAVSTISGILSPDEHPFPITGFHPPSPPPTQGPAATVRYMANYIRRQHIPVRSIVDTLLALRHVLPTAASKVILNMLYPSPWLPYSVEDPISFVDTALESPTIGICLSVGKSAFHREIFNQWLEDSSHNRAENPQQVNATPTPAITNSSSTATNNDNHGDLKTLRSLNSSPQASTVVAAQPVHPQATTPRLVIEDETGGFSFSESEIEDADDEEQHQGGADAPAPASTSTATPAAVRLSIQHETQQNPYCLHHGWDELEPYLNEFERLQHLPLFFCPANADAVLRPEDSKAGYLRSGSKWKDIIEYKDKLPRGGGGGGAAAAAPTVVTEIPAFSVSEIETLNAMQAGGGGPVASPLTDSNSTLFDHPSAGDTERLKRVSSGTSFVKSTLYHPISSGTGGKSSSALQIEDEYDPKNPQLRYRVPASVKVGHCDILGGKHAELVWKKIVDWLDVTTQREKEWRFRRRYSAK